MSKDSHFCKYCASELSDVTQSTLRDGSDSPAPSLCRACGARPKVEARFCDRCGAEIEPGGPLPLDSKRKKVVTLVIVGLGGMIVLILVAYSVARFYGSPQNAIVGKWQNTSSREVFEFFKDGTITVTNGGTVMAGNYRFIENDRLRLELGGLGSIAGPLIMKVSLRGDVLEMTMENGQSIGYRKVH